MSSFLARKLMAWVQRRSALRFEGLCTRPQEAQRATLLRILRRNADTEVGRRYGFRSVRDERDYQQRVPLCTAEDLAPAVQRMAAGEHRVLTAQDPHYFCQTGGTTGTPKLSPVTWDYTREYQETVQIWGHHLYEKYPDARRRRILYFVGTAEAGRTVANIPYGTMTGYTFGALPGFVQRMYALPYAVSRVTDYEAKYYAVLRLTVPADVGLAVSVAPSTLLVLGRKFEQHQEQLVADLEQGTLSEDFQIPEDTRRALAPFLRPEPTCAARLRALRTARHGPVTLQDAWPNLAVIACWKSGPSAPYVAELEAHYGSTPVWDAIYSATEGWMTVPMSETMVGGALAVGTHYFEFFPESDRERKGPALLTSELTVGRRYAIVLTASSGMYRYDIKDIVECVGHYHSTPMIAFSHKEAGFSNVVGEKLSEVHVNNALQSATGAAGVRVLLFSMAPRVAVPAHYVAHVAFAGEVTSEQAQNFLRTLEQTLAEQAWEYQTHRAAGDLGPVELAVLPAQSLDRWRERFQRGGGNEAQMKPRHLVPEMGELAALPVSQQIRMNG